MSCWQTFQDYALRSVSGKYDILGMQFVIEAERLLPKEDFTLCQQFVLIGSGMIWNVYFGIFALIAGFFLATVVALGKASSNTFLRKLSEWFVLLFRGSPLFIQFFFAYFAFLSLKQVSPFFDPFTAAWLGALIVLFLNTSAYTGEIFFGALRSIPKGDVEAADAYGFSGWSRFRKIIWPTMLRLAWPAYTNEAIFLFHATTLVFFTGFPAWQQRGDALYYANYFADKTFNPFVPYPILAMYFIIMTLVIIGIFGLISRRLNRHLPQEARMTKRPRMNLIR
ncbi:MAG: ABC transporter permease [Roseovarius sp.]